MRGLMMDRPLLVSSLLDYAARYFPEIEIVARTVDGSVHRSNWARTAERAAQLAHALRARGIGPGDRVASIAWNTHRHVELYYAVAGIGAVLHTINPRIPPEQVRHMIQHAGDRIVFYDSSFSALIEAIRPALPDVAEWILLEQPYEALLQGQPTRYDWPLIDENAACGLCYTSGTTGMPKGVLYSHRSNVLHALCMSLPEYVDDSARRAILPAVPMFHVNAWGFIYQAALLGAKLILPGAKLDGASLYQLIRDEGATTLAGVPTIWTNLLLHVDTIGGNLDGVRRIMSGGSAVPPVLIDGFARYGATVIQGWGMTELSPIGSMVPNALPDDVSAEKSRELQLGMGRPLFGVEMRIVDPEGNELPQNGEGSGHLHVRGPWIAAAYFDEAATVAFTGDGWFDTGDIATLCPKGYLRITDRAKDLIKSGGEWISSIDLENLAMSHPDVAAAAAIGLPHPRWSERPLLVVVPRAGTTLEETALLAWLAERLPRWWVPESVVLAEALPIGATGKVQKIELRKKYADYAWPTSPPAPLPQGEGRKACE